MTTTRIESPMYTVSRPHGLLVVETAPTSPVIYGEEGIRADEDNCMLNLRINNRKNSRNQR